MGVVNEGSAVKRPLNRHAFVGHDQRILFVSFCPLLVPCPLPGLGLSQDVAGATFMAAGSSAPELVTAFLGNRNSSS